MAMINCSGIAAGVDTLACISAATDYWIGYSFLIILTGILLFKFNDTPIRERMAGTLFVLSIVTFLGTVGNALFPDNYFTLAATLFLGSLVMLAIRN